MHSYEQFKVTHAAHIAALVDVFHAMPESSDVHWNLIEEMKSVLGAEAANNSTDDEDDQEAAISDAEEWVTDNCSSGGVAEDVAMALWLKGMVEGETFLRKAMGMPVHLFERSTV